jgi:predicted transcriptional regulator of viral defense system
VRTIDLLQVLKRHPVFDRETFASLANLEPPSASARLSRLVRDGRIERLWRDVYTVHNDPLLVATHLAFPSYISLWYALSHHGLTLQVPHEISVLTTMRTNRSSIEYEGMRISFTTIPTRYLYGFLKLVVGGHEVFMATPEKALVDSILLRRISPSEVFSIMEENADSIDISKIIAYVKDARSGTLAKRMGYMLSALGHDVFGQLNDLVYPTVVPLDTTLPPKGRTDVRWGLLDNAGLIA